MMNQIATRQMMCCKLIISLVLHGLSNKEILKSIMTIFVTPKTRHIFTKCLLTLLNNE